jgi:hypothetical protein
LHLNLYAGEMILHQHRHLRTNPEDAGLKDILERILNGVIVFEPSDRLLLSMNDLSTVATRVVVTPERRHRPFIVPKGKAD